MRERGLRRETVPVDEQARGERLDLFLARSLSGVSRKAVKKALDRGQVFVNGRSGCRAGYALQGSEIIQVTLEAETPVAAAAEWEILYRDADLLAMNKPPHIPSHPTVEGRANALDLVRKYLAGEGGDEPILLHRLDVGTSGVLLFALNRRANRELSRQFAERMVHKTYIALVEGKPSEAFEVCNHLKAGVRGKTVAVQSGGQPARTDVRRLGQRENIALVEARPHTGRTHQIRTHLAGEGFPLLGDVLYGGPEIIRLDTQGIKIQRPLLHALQLEFFHPLDGRPVQIFAPPPEDFLSLLQKLHLTDLVH